MPESTSRQQPAQEGSIVRVASAVIIVSFVLTLLYLGRVVLEPLAIAVLLAFVLTPPIRRLRSLFLGRVTSVIAVVGFALAILVALGFVMETQISHLAGEIPKYQQNIREKISSLNKALVSSGTLQQASSTLDSLASELGGKGPTSSSPQGQAGKANQQPAPIPVEVQKPQSATLQTIEELLSPIIEPISMAGLLVLFLVFILFYREDLRDRILRLGGTRDLQTTTAAMNDAGKRLSRYFLIQASINGCFGLFIGAALWIIGVPNFILWGMLAGILRFVPYVGTPMAAVFPLALASAIDPGWSKVLETALLFFVAELITGQAIEPVLQGQQTGLSPVAIVLAQLFWTLIWGVPGLLLAVPITVCIAVLGRHVEALSFLGVVLGDEPALAPHEGFYQRVLAGDAIEVVDQAESQLEEQRLSDYYDAVAMKALALAEADAARGRLSDDRQAEILRVIENVVEDLEDYTDEDSKSKQDNQPAGKGNGASDKGSASDADKEASPILLIPAQSAVDQAASVLLADVLRKRGAAPSIMPRDQTRRASGSNALRTGARIICISSFERPRAGALPARYLIRRWRRALPDARFLACFWRPDQDAENMEELRKKVGADFIATSLKDAAQICCDEMKASISKKGQSAIQDKSAVAG
ncbi:MAG: AI-2E family transporter [Rhodomicrobium sp.]